jgi:hypothetical protein
LSERGAEVLDIRFKRHAAPNAQSGAVPLDP